MKASQKGNQLGKKKNQAIKKDKNLKALSKPAVYNVCTLLIDKRTKDT